MHLKSAGAFVFFEVGATALSGAIFGVPAALVGAVIGHARCSSAPRSGVFCRVHFGIEPRREIAPVALQMRHASGPHIKKWSSARRRASVFRTV
jgi:hypothetical protein